jgi:hypothetical protein
LLANDNRKRSASSTLGKRCSALADDQIRRQELSGNISASPESQSGVPDTFEMPVPLYADETLLGLVNVSVDGGEFRFTSRTRPQQLHIDPKNTILKQ